MTKKPERAFTHTPVLLEECLRGLRLRPDGVYVDCTFGRGGHSRAILERLGAGGRLLVFDKDPEAIEAAKRLRDDPRLTWTRGSFTTLKATVKKLHLSGLVHGVLFDLGVSSPQFDDAARGFSFQRDGALDMRMDNTRGITAGEWLHRAPAADIARTLRQFGEERFARRIAAAIVRRRAKEPITKTRQLAELVAATVAGGGKKHPATRTFQALRIFINHELDELAAALPQAVEVLTGGGRLLVISFHSLEDRLVKHFMREQSRTEAALPREVPVTPPPRRPKLLVIGKPVRCGAQERAANPRARSAVLRVAERLAA